MTARAKFHSNATSVPWLPSQRCYAIPIIPSYTRCLPLNYSGNPGVNGVFYTFRSLCELTHGKVTVIPACVDVPGIWNSDLEIGGYGEVGSLRVGDAARITRRFLIKNEGRMYTRMTWPAQNLWEPSRPGSTITQHAPSCGCWWRYGGTVTSGLVQ